MCGRFVLLTDLAEIVERFGIEEAPAVLPRGDMLPGREVPAVVEDGKRRLVLLQWGLVPSWTRDPAVGRKLFNARAETLSERPSFRDAFRRRRCLVIADGFYEWAGEKGRRRASLFRLRNGSVFAFAGLYDGWTSPEGALVRTCTIVTTEANPLVAAVHHRMPVILPPAAESLWLDRKVHDQALLKGLLRPYPAEEMVAAPAGRPGLD